MSWKLLLLILAAVIVLIPTVMGLIISPVIAALRDTFSGTPPGASGGRRKIGLKRETSLGRRKG